MKCICPRFFVFHRLQIYLPIWRLHGLVFESGDCLRQAFTPSFQKSRPELTRYLHALYGHPAAQRVLRAELPAPKAELRVGDAPSIMGPIRQHIDPTALPWSGGVLNPQT